MDNHPSATLEEWKRRHAELQQIVEEKTADLLIKNRELEIEAALEHVRARTMDMQHSDELPEVAHVMFLEIQSLGIPAWSAGYNILAKDKKSCTCIMSSEGQIQSAFQLPLIGEKSFEEWYQAVVDNESFFVQELGGKDLEEHYQYLMSLPGIQKAVDPLEQAGISFPTYQVNHLSFFTHGFLLFITYEKVPDVHGIFKRFTRIFEQAYTRFLDLKKEETQAREAQINLALERVRARTMGMHKSEELAGISFELFKQVQSLGVTTWHCAFNIYDEGQNSSTEWGTNAGGTYPMYKTPREGIFLRYYEIGQTGQTLHIEHIGEDRSADHYAWLCTLPGVGEQLIKLRDSGVAFPTSQIDHVAYFKYGYLIFITYEPVPDAHDIFRRFAKGFEQTYTRFLDLKKAEEQAREAKIEAALEKVRSRTMAMREADELRDVVTVVVEKLIDLGVILDANGAILCTYFQDSKNVLHWIASPDFSFTGSYLLPYFDHPIFKAAWESKLSGAEYFSKAFSVEEKNSFFEYAFEHSDYKHFPDEFKEWVYQNDKHSLSFAWSENSAILIPSHTGVVPSETDIEILKRFAKVFEQAYVRFMDLQKAEAQAREAQIEVALERVRAQVNRMEKSEDLLDVVVAMRKEFVSLGYEAHYFWHMRWLPDTYQKAMTSGDGTRIGMVMELPRRIHGEIKQLAEWEKSDEPTVIFTMDAEAALDYVHKMGAWGDFQRIDPNMPTDDDIRHIGGLTYVMARTSLGEIGYSLPGVVKHVPQATLDILVRFARAFDLAHKRFEDLKISEQQARETQIELALERVRARTMAMQQSNELGEVSHLLNQQVRALGTKTWGCAFNIYGENDSTEWFGTEAGIMPPYKTPRENVFLRFYEKGQAGETFHVEEFTGDVCKAHYDYLCQLPVIGEMLNDLKAAGHSFPTFQIDHVAYFKYGYLLFITLEPALESHDIFQRFARVFEQTYTRFLDLKAAEEQTKQARIETALERVRAKAMAMQQPEELKDVAQVLRTEMGKLDIEELETCSIYIKEEYTSISECWYAIKDIREEETVLVKDHFRLDLNATWVGREMLAFYESESERVSIVMKGEARMEWINYCAKHSGPLQGYYGEQIPERTYHLYKFTHGAIGFASAGKISEDSWSILTRAASAFSLAYARFLDLTRAREDLRRLKEEKARAEEALTKLRDTQSQLIHAEKMASLGELTAGIAHEIKNPLNFVNNFSEVSGELLDDMVEEMKKGETDEVFEIIGDLKNNLQKIVEHGQRADSIVKGMLQHSRTDTGEKLPTDINALADEYLRLAYHGLRAKDKSFNAIMETDFDQSIGKVEVVPQEIGRVLLNLITNAFHAVNEKRLKSEASEYKPVVTVRTTHQNGNVSVEVMDNGSGIPDDIKDKIFQPFFTTKPTGEGTGLGLSLSYDIVKAHGGELGVETKEATGSTFTISLPVKRSK